MQADALTAQLSPPSTALDREQVSRVPLAALLACLLGGIWLILAPRTPDLAAQVYRVELFNRSGFVLWDNSWYGGHHIPGYSLLFPPLGALVGVRLLGVIAVVASAALFERIALVTYGPDARLGALFFAAAAAGDLWIGRITFALGVSFALAAVLALARPKRGRAAEPVAVLCAALCAMASPVAGLMLALGAVSYAISERRLRAAVLLLAPVLLVVLALQALFPEGGYEPFPVLSIAATLVVTLAFLWALPSQERLLRVGGCLYLVCVLLCVIHTPMGANVERYGVLLAGPLLLCALARHGGLAASPRPTWALAGVIAGIAVWVVWAPIKQTEIVQGDPATQASFYTPVERFAAAHGGSLLRMEVPFTRSHWEAALLAPHVPLARGWDRQLDKRYDGVLESGQLTPASFKAWLDRNAVSYVALPDVALDPSTAQEAALIRRGMPFLIDILNQGGWRIYEVLGAKPLLEGPGRLAALHPNSFTLLATRPGRFLVRVHHTPWWTVSEGSAQVSGAGEWTQVTAKRPGAVTVTARLSLGGALKAL